jgi:hypothetical protein
MVAPNPSGLGQSVTATATVSPTDGGGSVAFYANGAPIAGCSASPLTDAGTATCTTTSLPQGQDLVRAVYSGDAHYLGSAGDTGTSVGKGSTTTTAYPAQISKAKNGTYTTTLSATLTAYGAPVSGRTVVFSSDGATLCTAVTDTTGTASCGAVIRTNVAYRSLQKSGYTASFGGDAQYAASSAHAAVTG